MADSMITIKKFLVKKFQAVLASLAATVPFFSFLKKKDNGMDIFPGLIEERLKYEGLTRQILTTQILRQGQINSYLKHVDTLSMLIGVDGETPELIIRGNRIFAAEFLIRRYVQVAINFLNDVSSAVSSGSIHRKDYIKYLQDINHTLTYYFMLREDKNTLKLLYQSALANGNVISIDKLDKDSFDEFKVLAKKNDFVIDMVVVNRTELNDLKKLCAEDLDFEPIKSISSLVTGKFGHVWETILMLNDGEGKVVPEGMVFAFPTHVGELAIRLPLTVMSVDSVLAHVNNALRIFPSVDIPTTTPKHVIGEQVSQVIFDISKVVVGIKPGCIIPDWMKMEKTMTNALEIETTRRKGLA